MRDGSESYIFQMVEKQDGKPLEKGEALKAIGARVVDEKAKTAARIAAQDAIKGGAKFVKETDFLQKNNPVIPGIGQLPRDAAGVLALDKGKTFDRPVEIAGKYYIFSCIDEKQPDDAQWQKDKESFKRAVEGMTRDVFLAAFKEGMKKGLKIRVYWNEI